MLIIIIIIINQLANHINDSGKQGVQLLPGLLELVVLLFADDTVLLSTTPSGLQHQLNCLKTCCDNLKLEVNKEKTKIMVFRKGGHLSKNEIWYFDDHRLEVVNNYCYLGYIFTPMLSSKQGTGGLVTKAKKATFFLCRTLRKCKEMTRETFFQIFDSKVQPILLYASEIWGFQKLDSIEKVHIMACKYFLNVPKRTPNKLVYGELGRYPLFVNSYIRCVKYWLRLVSMEQSRLPKQAYDMLVKLDENNKSCWVSGVREILSTAGFHSVWLSQGVGNVKSFLRAFKQRLIDIYTQDWFSAMRNKERYELYTSFKLIFETEKYFTNVDIYCFRVALSQLRMGVLPLNNNLHRFSESPVKKQCVFCKNITEDELHFLLRCPLYSDLRSRFIDNSGNQTVQSVCSNTSCCSQRSLAKFVFHAINRRKCYN